MKIAYKLLGSFIGISLLTGVVGLVAVAQSHKIAETSAIAEAENLAQAIATAITTDPTKYQALTSAQLSIELQDYIAQLHQLQNRDVEVVNQKGQIVADAIPADIGQTLEAGQGSVVRKTLQDGVVRTFLEQNSDYPQGIAQIVVPLKMNHNQIMGAVVLEWSSLYGETIAQARPALIMIGFTSLGSLVLALFIGWQISRSIARPLQSVTAIAQRVTQTSNFNLQAPVTTTDEIATLATAFNDLIHRVKLLLHEKEQRSETLQQTLNQLQTTQLQLIQTEKMSSLGQLVAGVAHEINNPINFIHGNLIPIDEYTQDLLRVVQSYQSHYPHPPQSLQAVLDRVDLDFVCQDAAKLVQSMKVGTDRIRQIVLSLRNFSRLDEAEFKAVDLHEGIDSTLLILQHRLKPKADAREIEVVREYGQLPPVECYPGQLNQVFMNLLSNAIDALEGTHAPALPKIWISTQLIPERRVRVTIADNGTGMTAAVRSRIFDPFFTTKPIGKGTGLGLSISYQIVTEKHGGAMRCDSTIGEGTKFAIEIPVRQTI